MLDYKYLGDFLGDANKKHLNVMYAQVCKEGRVIEEWKRIDLKTRMNGYSICKSLVSLAAGIAASEGLVSLDEKIVDIYPEYAKSNKSPYLGDVTLRHLLTMTSGLKNQLFFAHDTERYTTFDWIEYFFQEGEFVNKPGEKFLYSNFNTYVLSCVLEMRSGKILTKYLRERLLEDTGIHNADWLTCPKGHVLASNGFFFTIDELSAYGQLLLNKGSANGKQLIPLEYFEEATAKQVDLIAQGVDDFGHPAANTGYGYYFIGTEDGDIHLSGTLGQELFVFPKQRMTVAVLSLEPRTMELDTLLWEDTCRKILGEA